jgi:hypothetical protein
VSRENKNSKFWGIHDKIENDLNKFNLEVLKVGVFFGDFLYDVESLRRGWVKRG